MMAVGAGDVRAFEQLAARHGPWATQLAARFSGNASDADDIVQEALLRVWVKAPSWRNEPDAAPEPESAAPANLWRQIRWMRRRSQPPSLRCAPPPQRSRTSPIPSCWRRRPGLARSHAASWRTRFGRSDMTLSTPALIARLAAVWTRTDVTDGRDRRT
jgi:hypothetical protein